MTDRGAIVAALSRAYPATNPKDQYAPDLGLTHWRGIEFVHRPHCERYDDDGQCPIQVYDCDGQNEDLSGCAVEFEFDAAGGLKRVYAR